MTFEQYHNLMDKYGIEVDADLHLYYRNYLLGRIETDETYQDPNRQVIFVTFPGKWWAVSNYNKACDCFETFCRKKVKEIDEFYKLRRIKGDFYDT